MSKIYKIITYTAKTCGYDFEKVEHGMFLSKDKAMEFMAKLKKDLPNKEIDIKELETDIIKLDT